MKKMAVQTGVALVSVMWVLLLLSVVAAIGNNRARNQLQQAQADFVATQRKYNEQSALFIAIATARDFSCDAENRRMSFGKDSVHVRCEAESARLNINHASAAQLQRFFVALNVEQFKAAQLADEILDWRDLDMAKRVQGAEEKDYLLAGRSILPANRAFAAVSEVRHVLSVTPALYRKAAPYLTVYSLDAKLAVRYLSKPVFESIKGSEHYDYDIFDRQREQSSHTLSQQFPLLNERDITLSPATLLRFTVHSGEKNNGISGKLEAVVDIAGKDSSIKYWSQGAAR